MHRIAAAVAAVAVAAFVVCTLFPSGVCVVCSRFFFFLHFQRNQRICAIDGIVLASIFCCLSLRLVVFEQKPIKW